MGATKFVWGFWPYSGINRLLYSADVIATFIALCIYLDLYTLLCCAYNVSKTSLQVTIDVVGTRLCDVQHCHCVCFKLKRCERTERETETCFLNSYSYDMAMHRSRSPSSTTATPLVNAASSSGTWNHRQGWHERPTPANGGSRAGCWPRGAHGGPKRTSAATSRQLSCADAAASVLCSATAISDDRKEQHRSYRKAVLVNVYACESSSNKARG